MEEKQASPNVQRVSASADCVGGSSAEPLPLIAIIAICRIPAYQ